MNVYIFQAALLCEACGESKCAELAKANKYIDDDGQEQAGCPVCEGEHADIGLDCRAFKADKNGNLRPDSDMEAHWDSGMHPKGPYPNGGGEADIPHHCDHCGVFLENPLTPEGDSSLRAEAEKFKSDMGWAEIADMAESGGKQALADGIRFYFAPGM